MFDPVAPNPNFSALEEETLAFWEEHKVFQESMRQNRGKPLYTIYDGPPTANAKPPLHTMVPMSFKDAVGRYQTMKGNYVPRQAGWDTHGLPVEVQVEKAMGLSGKQEILSLVPGDESASIAAFNEACRTSVWQFKQDWDKFVPRVGYWVDTENPYITYDPSYIEGVWKVFKEVWEKDLVYKDYKVVPYCPRCQTSLSAAEVAQEYQDVKDVTVYVSLPWKSHPRRSFLAWTTTPWTLPGNVALALGADMDYVVVRQKSDGDDLREYVLAKERLEILEGDYVIVEEMKGSELVGITYEPLFPGIMEIESGKHFVTVAADFVTATDGTGIVHIAPMYGEDDFSLGKAEKLTMRHTVGTDGHFEENVPDLAGIYIRDALGKILTHLSEAGKLYRKQTVTHSYPFCWRCKTALVYYAKDSWYVAMSKLRSELVASNERVTWYPEHIKEGRFGDFIREARDWAISRERFWGTPLPVWTSKKGKRICVGSFTELKKYAKEPKAVGEGFDPHRPGVDDIVLVKDGETYHREPYVLDVWFDSGAMPYASGRDSVGQFPADFVAEAIDQTRGWFYTLMALGTILKGSTPYRNVVCMGHLVDENGKKMSKSGPNAVVPKEIFATCGVDAIRWYIYTVNSPGEAKTFSVKEVQVAFRRCLLLAWNMYNYFVTYATMHAFTAPGDGVGAVIGELDAKGQLTVLDRWALSREEEAVQLVTEYLNGYDFMRAGRTIEDYVSDLSTWYLRRSRKRTDQAFFAVMYKLLLTYTKLIAPLAPFMADTMYRNLATKEMPVSVHLQQWPEISEKETRRNGALERDMRMVRQAVELGLAVRAQEKIKVRQPLATVYLTLPEGGSSLDQELQSVLAEELNVLEVKVVAIVPDGMPQKEDYGVGVALDLKMTDELIQAGLAREFLRQVQQLRKQAGMQPGQLVELVVGPSHRSVVEPLLISNPSIVEEAYLKVTEETWKSMGEEEVKIDGEIVLVSLRLPAAK